MSAFFTAIKIISLSIILILVILLLLIMLWPARYKVYVSYQNQLPQYDIEVSWIFKFIYLKLSNYPGNIKKFAIGWKIPAPKKNSEKDFQKNNTKNDSNIDKNISADIDNKKNIEENNNIDKYNFKENIDRFKNIIDKAKTFYNCPDRNEIISESFLLVKRIYKTFHNTIFDLNCEIGFDSPEKTGFALAAISILKTVINLKNSNIYIKSDFDREIIDVKLNVKGKFYFGYALWHLVIFLLSKPIWKIIKENIFVKNKERID